MNLPVYLAPHFFLFRNIFRVVRRRELTWAALFVLNVGLWFLLGRLDWFSVLACRLPVSVGAIARETKATRNHRLNPKLNEYLEKRIS